MRDYFRRYLTAATLVYFTVLFGWLVIYLVSGDHFGLISVINMLAVYPFLPLLLAIFVALYSRSWVFWAGVVLGVVAFLWLFGRLFIPYPQPTSVGSERLMVMTYNLLGWQANTNR